MTTDQNSSSTHHDDVEEAAERDLRHQLGLRPIARADLDWRSHAPLRRVECEALA